MVPARLVRLVVQLDLQVQSGLAHPEALCHPEDQAVLAHLVDLVGPAHPEVLVRLGDLVVLTRARTVGANC